MFRVLFLIFIVVIFFVFSLAETRNTPLKFGEVFKLNKNNLKKMTENFQAELAKDKDILGYIINYGTQKEIAKREKIIKGSIAFRKFDQSRITIVRGGKFGKARSVFYLVPTKAEPKL